MSYSSHQNFENIIKSFKDITDLSESLIQQVGSSQTPIYVSSSNFEDLPNVFICLSLAEFQNKVHRNDRTEISPITTLATATLTSNLQSFKVGPTTNVPPSLIRPRSEVSNAMVMPSDSRFASLLTMDCSTLKWLSAIFDMRTSGSGFDMVEVPNNSKNT
ncbi:21822_t:CDS:2, partial [Entrophospora sp. SA101]